MRQALELALEALERSVATCFDQYSHQQVMGKPEHFVNEAITALRLAIDAQNMASESTYKEALEQEQKPVVERAWFTISELNAWADKKLAENPHWVMPTEEPERKEALAKQEQGEPVAYINIEKRKLEWAHDYMSWDTPTVVNLPRIPLYTTPQQRTWVGLTDEEIDQGLLRSNYAMQTAGAWRDGVEWATKQLKEKNT
jgi:hypothetical protein